KSFIRLREVSPGFNADGVLALRVSLLSTRYPQGAARTQFFSQAIERIKSLPGVRGAGGVLSLPLGGDTFNVGRAYIREGRPATAEEAGGAMYLAATPDYFRTLQIPVLKGRTFTEQDNDKSPMVVVVNETLA